MLTDDDSLWWERSRTAAGLSDPTLPGLRGREEEEEEEEEEEGGAQSVHGSDFPSAPHLLQLSPGPHPPGRAIPQKGVDGASNGVRCICGQFAEFAKNCSIATYHKWHHEMLNLKTANSKDSSKSQFSLIW